MGIPPEGETAWKRTWPWFPPPLGCPGTSPVADPMVMPILSGQVLLLNRGSLWGPCWAGRNSAKVWGWKVDSRKGKSKQRSRNGREEKDLVCGKVSWWWGSAPPVSRSWGSSEGSSRQGWWVNQGCLVSQHLWHHGRSPSAMSGVQWKAVS